MRIAAFSDLHRDQEAARRVVEAGTHADIVIGAGDFATHGKGHDETLSILQRIDRPVLLVCGNHDDLGELRRLAAGRPSWHVLHGESVSVLGHAFFGLGYEVARSAGALPQSCITEQQAADMLEHCPPGAILVTHAPPRGIADLQRDGTHQGSVAIRAAIGSKQPPLVLCGHIHHAWGSYGRVGSSLVVNLGPAVTLFDLAEHVTTLPLTLP